MKAGVRRFLWFWLLPLVIFLAGLRRAFLTGQTDPWDWGMPAALLATGAGLLLARRGWVIRAWVALGGVGMALIFCTVAAARAPGIVAALGLATIAILAVCGGAFIRQHLFASRAVEKPRANASRLCSKRTAAGAACFILAALLLWRGPAQPLHPVADRPKLAVITGLPLFWAESGQNGPRDAPIVTVLRRRFTIMPLDDPLALKASGAQRLLLAQPRALTPAQRVAIDTWVQDGGTALVLADPLLRWPSHLPLGDRRRAPSTSLLQPLLAHWGFKPTGIEDDEIRHFTSDGAVLTLSGVQLYGATPGDGVVHRKLGKGVVLLLGDADAIDDALWLADPARPLDPRFWVADTPARVVQWLGGPSVPADRRWMRDAKHVTAALRWALLVGTIWAMMGALALRGSKQGFDIGTKKEHDTMERDKTG